MSESEQTKMSPDSAGHHKEGALCPACAAQASPPFEQFIYSLGHLDVRFPTVGLEREFQQRERHLRAKEKPEPGETRGERLFRVLNVNPHLARRICYVHSVGDIPAYIVVPTSTETLTGLVDAVRKVGHRDQWNLIVGRRVGTSNATTCAGLLAPIVACDQVYSFALEDWSRELTVYAEPALRSHKLKEESFGNVARELFERVARSTENIGGTDAYRALNYLLVQHPGLFLAAAQRSDGALLDRIETRLVQGTDSRRLVAVILTFLDRTTGVPERLFCRVDVSEEWPFLADGPDSPATPLGLLPFVENALLGLTF